MFPCFTRAQTGRRRRCCSRPPTSSFLPSLLLSPPPPSFLSPSPLPFLSSSIFSNFSLFLVIYFPPSLLARALFLEQRKKCISAERGRSMKILRQRAWAGSRYSRSSQLSSSRICEAETRRDRGATRRRNASEFCGTY